MHQTVAEVNVEHIYHSLVKGIGFSGLQKQTSFLGDETISSGSYTRHSQFLFNKMSKYYTDMHKKQINASMIAMLIMEFHHQIKMTELILNH